MADFRFPSPGVDARFPGGGLDAYFPSPGVSGRFAGGKDLRFEPPGIGHNDPPFELSQLPAGSTLDNDPAVGVTADGAASVTSWAAAIGTATFTPTGTPKADASPIDGLPRVTFSGVDNGPYMTSNEAHFERWADFLVVERSAANQNAVATNKNFYAAPRASNGANTTAWLLRTPNDAEQDDIVISGIGSGNVAVAGVFPKASRRLLRIDRFVTSRLSVDGASVATQTGSAAGSSTQTLIGGVTSSSSARAAISFLRRLRQNTDALPGKHEQIWNLLVIEGFLAWKYNRVAEMVAANPSHPFAHRPPLASDYTGKNYCWQSWGNSLMNGTATELPAILGVAARGIVATNGGVGGESSNSIYARFVAGYDTGAGTSTPGILIADQRKKITVIGDLGENDGTAGVSQSTRLASLAAMVAAVESAQGVSAGQARLIVWGRWRGNGEAGTDGRIASNDAESDIIQAAYPNYFINVGKELAKLSLPGQPYADADAAARGVIGLALRKGGGDLLHLNTTGYAEAAKIELAFATSRGLLA